VGRPVLTATPAPYPVTGGDVASWECTDTSTSTPAPDPSAPPVVTTGTDCTVTAYNARPTVAPAPAATGQPAALACTSTDACVTDWSHGPTQIVAGGFTLMLLLTAAILVVQLRSR
jgi:hypothetical protein